MRLAQQMAVESDFVTADLVEVTEFPELAQRYRVRAVPRTIVNDVGSEVNGNRHAAPLFREIVENGLPLLERNDR